MNAGLLAVVALTAFLSGMAAEEISHGKNPQQEKAKANLAYARTLVRKAKEENRPELYRQALSYYGTARMLDPSLNFVCLAGAGRCYYEINESTKALVYFESALKEKDSPTIRKWLEFLRKKLGMTEDRLLEEAAR